MLRFIKDNLATIDGVEIYPIISLLIFVLFFTGVLVWALRVDKKKVEALEQMPLLED
jgi:cbb3-type cytochrome oxidase subunit 3